AREDDAVRAVVMTGAGKFFSGGLDLRQTTNAVDLGALLLDSVRDAWLDLLTFPKPMIGMLTGHAIAGGVVNLLACEYRLGVEGNYKIGLNEVAIGASFPRVAFEIVRLRLTHQQANELLLGARVYPASEAVRLGVVDELLPAAGFEDEVMRRAAIMGSHSRGAYAHTKAALLKETVQRVMAETREEAEAVTAVWMEPESMAARMAQAQKLGKA
ncbi:MAG: enoyl-CoA hydratase/isomerase family protein, partial [Dehalococcoidia bacterium]